MADEVAKGVEKADNQIEFGNCKRIVNKPLQISNNTE